MYRDCCSGGVVYRIVIGNLHDFPLHRQLESMDLMAIIHKKCIAEWNGIKAHLLFRSLRVLLTLCSPWKLIIISINYGIPSAADRKTFWLRHLLGCGRNASSVCQFFQMVISTLKFIKLWPILYLLFHPDTRRQTFVEWKLKFNFA